MARNEPEPKGAPPEARSGRATRWLRVEGGNLVRLGGLVAAVVVAVLVNVLGARHYTRWDWSVGHRYSLSPATLDTLHALPGKVEIWVLLGSADPLEQSVKQLLASYRAETPLLDVHTIDPDRDAMALVDVQQRFKIEAGRGADGRVVTDAVLVVAREDRHWFVTAGDLFEVAKGDDPRAQPREEQAITGAIRSVIGGDKARLCFTTGHGELAIDPSREGWIGDLKAILEKDNYELASVDTTRPDLHEPFEGCAVAVIAGPKSPFTKEEENRLRTFLLQGGNALVAAGPMPADDDTGLTASGLAAALAPFGIALGDDLVLDPEPSVAIPDTHGAGFFVAPRPHPVTQALVPASPADHPPRVATLYARSLRHVSAGDASAANDLLVTSDKAYALTSIKGAAAWTEAPEKKPSDLPGPFAVAMASERPKLGPNAPHGPRIVVIGSGIAMAEDNWAQPRPVRGMAFLVESALSWLASKPQVLDVPERPAVAAGMRITEEDRREVRSYVLIYMPLAAGLLGLAVALRRRSTEGEPLKKAGDGGKKGPKPRGRA